MGVQGVVLRGRDEVKQRDEVIVLQRLIRKGKKDNCELRTEVEREDYKRCDLAVFVHLQYIWKKIL